ncbi:uracil-DNA glycosylase [Microbulbifer sp. YPW1]|uniref:uracil-DNA glycosylase n=1 Tax=Microbulbifer sp. YPW1 TaxID=2745199 RepID=UPI0015983819|nr:uracil-DNA glycosylase [Microbulbifer sp. YPW1]QKX19142.1 uracil-DNA glycosylase [Microbulbifer sp. YPW1]
MQAPGNIKIHPSWFSVLQPEFNKPYMAELRQFLLEERQAGKSIFPPGGQIFNAFNSTPFDQVKVVILGQDPYHGAGQAHGLCFSVMPGVRVPPSLKNIYKELQSDLGIEPPNHGCLQPWAEQGVLLLNATLTVEESRAGAHQGRGWEQFTDAAVHALAEQREGVVFILWGSYAQKKGSFIDGRKHLVLKGPHPSPLSAHRGFFGTRPFSQTNSYLQQRGEAPINWALPAASELRRVAVEIG